MVQWQRHQCWCDHVVLAWYTCLYCMACICCNTWEVTATILMMTYAMAWWSMLFFLEPTPSLVNVVFTIESGCRSLGHGLDLESQLKGTPFWSTFFFVSGEDRNLLCRRWTSTLCRTKLHPHKLWPVCGEVWFWNQPFLNGVPCSIQSPLHLDLWCLISAHTHRIVQALAHHSAKVWLVPLAKIFFCFPAGLKHHLHRYFFLMLPNCDDMGFLHLLMSLHGPSQEHCVGFELQPVTLEPKKHTRINSK